ncbi:hypothetical protein [Clostridium sp.]|uniref:hypothetical protein n=1 Tax=Clostridium sp. TaxID=1506 RepID=UPI0032164268
MNLRFKNRVEALKSMHKLMELSNDEELYMVWVQEGVPDCPSDDDFESMAEDDEEYNRTVDLFLDLIKDKNWR